MCACLRCGVCKGVRGGRVWPTSGMAGFLCLSAAHHSPSSPPPTCLPASSHILASAPWGPPPPIPSAAAPHLDGHFEHLAGDELLQLDAHLAAHVVRLRKEGGGRGRRQGEKV